MTAKSEPPAAIKLLKSISQSTEEKFLGIGSELTRAVGLLEKITTDFASLSDGLRDEALTDATRDLTGAASDVANIGSAITSRRAVNDRLKRSLPAIGGDLSRIYQTVHTVGILAMNGKIAAAGIGASGGDFSSQDFLLFAKEVDRLVKVAQASLHAFRDDLTQLERELQNADQGQAQFEKQQTEAIRSIPKWLSDSVDAAAKHRQQAVTTSSMVKERSTRVQRRVGEAIMSLQIGDITRQRIEHVEEALEVIGNLLRGGKPATDKDAWWSTLTDEQQRLGAAEIYRLQAAQLAQTADDFQSGVQQIIVALKAMAEDAREILRVSNEAFGVSDRSAKGPLGELEENVDHALGLLRRFKTAQDAAYILAKAVRDSVARSARHLETVRSLEIDLRLLGLNMTFRCDRLGNSGRALNVVAQELRACADQTTEDASAVMTGLASVTKIVGGLSDEKESPALRDLSAMETVMTRSVTAFRAAGQSIGDALAVLLGDGQAVATALETAANAITFHDEVAQRLRDLASELAATAEELGNGGIDADLKERVLSLINGRYTMASERAMHERFSGLSGSKITPLSATTQAPSETSSLEDILF